MTGCMGQCEYCYLNTNLGDKPFIRVHANVDEILAQAQKYMDQRAPEITIFEGAATSDPVPVEPYTHSLQKAIDFFGKSSLGRFRFVTKFSDVDTLLNLDHKGHIEARFSVNTPTVIQTYEKATSSYRLRIEAGIKMAKAGYLVGFLYPNWKEEYRVLLQSLKEELPMNLAQPITFEIISHRYTITAKNRILQVFPESSLPMNNDERQYKYGQFGYGKYVYGKENMKEMKDFFNKTVDEVFDKRNVQIKYII